MKSFAIYVFKLLGTLLFLMFVLEQVYNYAFANGVVRSKLQKVLSLEKTDSFDYVFLGSSRTENTIDCEVIKKLTGKSCINLGISGGSLEDSYILLQLLVQQGVQLKDVFVQVDYTYNGTGMTAFLKSHLIPFKKKPAIHTALSKEDDGIALLYFPFYGYLKNDKVVGFREFLNQLTHNKTNIDYENGFWPMEGVGQKLYGSLPESIAEENKALLQMEYLLKEQGLGLNYFIAPYCSQVENRDYVKKLEKKLPKLRNYVGLFDTKNEYFANCGHVNATGARVFTEILIADFLKTKCKTELVE